MAEPLKLHSTIEGNDKLWHAEDKARSTSRNITVDRAALKALLLDHALMFNTLRDKRIPFSTPED